MVLQKMERYGVLIDTKKLTEQGIIIKDKIAILENTAYQLAGEMFNLNSPQQLQEIFYNKFIVPSHYKFSKSNFVFDSILKLIDKYLLIEIKKLISIFGAILVKEIFRIIYFYIT